MKNPKEPPLVRVRYRDHLLFRNIDPEKTKPILRETVGWLWRESPEAVLILWDRSVSPLPQGRIEPKASGLVILRSEIVSLRRLEP